MKRIVIGQKLAPRELHDIRAAVIQVPDPRRIVHLQFRRFAGCPICNLHLRSIAARHDEIAAAGILEIVVFSSSARDMSPYQDGLPFPAVADPSRTLFTEFGVGSSIRSVLDPRAWGAGIRGVLNRHARGSMRAKNGWFGLPADFLIDCDGVVLALNYGIHADDQWSVDEILNLSGHPRSS